MSTQNIFGMTDTWNAGGTTFTAIGMNVTDTASAAASLLIDLQVGGVSQFRVSKGGRITAQTLTLGLGGQTTVADNTALGFQALNSASLTGSNNVGVGYRALLNNTTGSENGAIGRGALQSNTTGSSNISVGVDALFSNTTGGSNIAMGTYALLSNTTGGSNSALGRDALRANTTGGDNTGVGEQAGDVITTGARNTIVGANSDPSAATGIDQTVIGEGLTGKGNDTFFCGGTNGAYNEKNVTTWETTSDARIKKDIADFAGGLEVIKQVRVRTFQYRTPEEITELSQSAAIRQPGVQIGVIAQELQAVLPQCVTENSTGVLSVNTDPLVWYVINAVQQLSAEVKALKGK